MPVPHVRSARLYLSGARQTAARAARLRGQYQPGLPGVLPRGGREGARFGCLTNRAATPVGSGVVAAAGYAVVGGPVAGAPQDHQLGRRRPSRPGGCPFGEQACLSSRGAVGVVVAATQLCPASGSGRR